MNDILVEPTHIHIDAVMRQRVLVVLEAAPSSSAGKGVLKNVIYGSVMAKVKMLLKSA
jgi:hypothetical protein